MKPWITLDTAEVPGGGEFRLLRRDREFSIMVGSNTLMNSRMSGSEIALAELACDRLRGRRNCRVLIGGYGLSEAELLVRVVTGFLNAMSVNIRGFSENHIPRGVLHLTVAVPLYALGLFVACKFSGRRRDV